MDLVDDYDSVAAPALDLAGYSLEVNAGMQTSTGSTQSFSLF